MIKLIWRLRYTRHMAKRLGGGWWAYKVSWQSSEVSIDEFPDEWHESTPEGFADEDLTYWTE